MLETPSKEMLVNAFSFLGDGQKYITKASVASILRDDF
jgi:hypothetical protein